MDLFGNDYTPPNYMGLIQSYSYDLSNLADIISKLIGSYKLLVASAEELNRIALAKKNDVEGAIDRADELGKILDNLLDVLDVQTIMYTDYIRSKSQFISNNFSFNEIIKYEIDNHLKHIENEHHDK